MRSLTLPDSQLEAAHHRAIEKAKEELPADDTQIKFTGIDLSDDPSLDYEADSHTIGRTIRMAVSADREWVWSRTNRVWDLETTVPLWREDASWRDLLIKTWLREGRGVRINVVPRPGRAAENESRWYASCRHPADEMRPENTYILRDGRLEPGT